MTNFTGIFVNKNKIYHDIMSFQSTLSWNDSLFININKFQSISNILDSFSDLFCHWLRTSRMMHLEPCEVHSNAFYINGATLCNIWKVKLARPNSSWKELSNGTWFAYIHWPPGLALNKLGMSIPLCKNVCFASNVYLMYHRNLIFIYISIDLCTYRDKIIQTTCENTLDVLLNCVL